MVSRVIEYSKAEGETLALEFDFLSDLVSPGETLVDSEVTVVVYSGTDLTPSSILDGSSTISGSVVTQSVTAGTAGVQYLLTCAATTSSGQVLLIRAFLSVLE